MSKLINIARWCFAGAALGESILILNDAGKAEVMLTNMLSVEEIRVAVVLVSLLLLTVLSLVATEDA